MPTSTVAAWAARPKLVAQRLAAALAGKPDEALVTRRTATFAAGRADPNFKILTEAEYTALPEGYRRHYLGLLQKRGLPVPAFAAAALGGQQGGRAVFADATRHVNQGDADVVNEHVGESRKVAKPYPERRTQYLKRAEGMLRRMTVNEHDHNSLRSIVKELVGDSPEIRDRRYALEHTEDGRKFLELIDGLAEQLAAREAQATDGKPAAFEAADAQARRRELLAMTATGREVLSQQGKGNGSALFAEDEAAERRRKLLAMSPLGRARLAMGGEQGSSD